MSAATRSGYSIIIFSRNRPLQLYALLESYFGLSGSDDKVVVLYLKPAAGYAEGYRECAEMFGSVRFVKQERRDLFKATLLGTVSELTSSRLLLLVDDMVFFRPFSLNDFDAFDLTKCVPCLDLGKNVDYCYVSNKHLKERRPSFQETGKFIMWNWNDDFYSVWNLPLRASSNIYDREEILRLMDSISFTSPNTLELAMSVGFESFSRRKAVAYLNSCLVSFPFNIVQEDHPTNRHGDLSAEFFLDKWNSGQKLNVSSFMNMNFNSTHALPSPRFEIRHRKGNLEKESQNERVHPWPRFLQG